MRAVTLCFLVSRAEGATAEGVCLGMKKVGFGVRKWAGIGGKVEEAIGETTEQAARRELREEILVEAAELDKVAEITFLFPRKPSWDQRAHVYLVRAWRGEPTETDEMRPRWFAADAIPYEEMWDDAKHWLPKVLAGERLRAQFSYASESAVDHVSIRVLPPGERFAGEMRSHASVRERSGR